MILESERSHALQSEGSQKNILLHGNLDVWIFGATNLPNKSTFKRVFHGDGAGSSKIQDNGDPYVLISVNDGVSNADTVLCRTFVIKNSKRPVWNLHLNLPVAHKAAGVKFTVKDNYVFLGGSKIIGIVAISAEQICSGKKIEDFFPIPNSNGKPFKEEAFLKLSIQFIPIEKQTVYQNGAGKGVPDTYFPLRRGGKVTLYQDAHAPDGCLPGLEMDYEHDKCWQDIFDAICRARHLIYITGWSVYNKVRLVRGVGVHGSYVTLGDLLKAKSEEGVTVLLLLWDDPTSLNFGIYQTRGLMKTHNEETRRYFKDSSVKVLLCPRSAGKKESFAKQQEMRVYSHHQKTLIVDSDAGNEKRKITAFVGGFDLCDGRYDTPKHPILRTSKTVHKDDFHNPTFKKPDIGCPRQPWHDLHCKIDGPAAYDVLKNFHERWLKASKSKRHRIYADDLLKIEKNHEIIGSDAPCSNENDPENWHVQVFRSIDSNSAKGFRMDPNDASYKNLVCGKYVLIDMSIHAAYVKAIRAAQHFIYIENQYFIGSSYNWSSHNDSGANNLIPMEIALKIANKIKAKERFSAYIVIPMWPEGDPTKGVVQRILFWQHKTMEMMYEIIYAALEEVGLENTPQDYLNFFCLGNREATGRNGASNGNPAENTPQGLARKNRRFMIYVHSKGMIVDDEYVILGSANINQRSLEGTRDTEIAMGAYQPQHTRARKGSSPHGQIYGYRKSLWAEHIGEFEECFDHPKSLECIKRVRELGELNWQQFVSEEITEMEGHLLKYPVDVDAKGKVSPLAGWEKFPDVGGDIVGSDISIPEEIIDKIKKPFNDFKNKIIEKLTVSPTRITDKIKKRADVIEKNLTM